MSLVVNSRGWQILDAVDLFLIEYESWMQKDYHHFDARLSDALDAMLAAIDGDCPMGFGNLLFWLKETRKLVEKADQDEGLDFNHPVVKLFLEIKRIRNQKDKTPKQRIESFESLLKMEGMSHGQIANMYGLVEYDGTERTDLVTREIRSPGSVINLATGLVNDVIDGWDRPHTFPPARVGQEEDRNSKQEVDPHSMAARKPKQPAIAPETFEQLFSLEGISNEQIAAMKQVTVEEVDVLRRHYAEKNAASRTESEVREEAERQAIHDRRKAEHEAATAAAEAGESSASGEEGDEETASTDNASNVPFAPTAETKKRLTNMLARPQSGRQSANDDVDYNYSMPDAEKLAGYSSESLRTICRKHSIGVNNKTSRDTMIAKILESQRRLIEGEVSHA